MVIAFVLFSCGAVALAALVWTHEVRIKKLEREFEEDV